MKLAIAIKTDDNVKDISDITNPIIESYSKTCGADCVKLEKPHPIHLHFKIMQCKELLEQYDRVLVLDTDVLITPSCPNLFELVPRNMVGTIFEDVGSRREDRLSRIKLVQQQWGDIGWTEHYINTGVFLVSKEHRILFEEDRLWTDRGYDDVTIGYRINNHSVPVGELDYRFNHMSMFSEEWNDYANRFNSFIIHYAGQGVFYESFCKDKLEQIKSDLNQLYGDGAQ